jgi:uncharacterized protein YjbK
MIEREATLVVVSERPEELFSRIDGFTSIGPYTLIPSISLKIEDHYLDTAEKALTRCKWALRTRNLGPETGIALKGPSTATDWGGVERVEMDLVWNPDSLSKVLSELRGHRLGVTLREDWKFSPDPLRTLTAAGLQVVQHRRTARRSKKVVKTETNAEAAELALDSVVYFLAEGEVSHFEIEIEAREIGDCDAVKMISEFLRNLFGSQLLPWTHSKLATGEAVASLMQRGSSEGWLDAGHLTETAYQMIDQCLNEKG